MAAKPVAVLRGLRRMPPEWGLAASFLLAQLAAGFLVLTLIGSLQPSGMADFHVMRDAAAKLFAGQAGDFPYPPPAAFPLVPLAHVPYELAAAIWVAVLLGCVPGMLLALGIRDWRCHAATLLAAPTLAVLGSGALSSLLALGTALLWRYRDRRVPAILLSAAVVVAKIFLWPLALWLLATGRRRVAVGSVAMIAALGLGGWAATGFAGFAHYPHQLSWMAGLEQGSGYSPVALGLALGLPVRAAQAAAALAGGFLIAAMFYVARGEDGERRSFTLAILASLLLTPISWLHYFVLLFVPIALARPRLSPLWLAPLAFWLVPMRSEGNLRLIAIGFALYCAVCLTAALTHARAAATA